MNSLSVKLALLFALGFMTASPSFAACLQNDVNSKMVSAELKKLAKDQLGSDQYDSLIYNIKTQIGYDECGSNGSEGTICNAAFAIVLAPIDPQDQKGLDQTHSYGFDVKDDCTLSPKGSFNTFISVKN